MIQLCVEWLIWFDCLNFCHRNLDSHILSQSCIKNALGSTIWEGTSVSLNGHDVSGCILQTGIQRKDIICNSRMWWVPYLFTAFTALLIACPEISANVWSHNLSWTQNYWRVTVKNVCTCGKSPRLHKLCVTDSRSVADEQWWLREWPKPKQNSWCRAMAQIRDVPFCFSPLPTCGLPSNAL